MNGCFITPGYARIDFEITGPLDKAALTTQLATLVAASHPIVIGRISKEDLHTDPILIRNMRLRAQRGGGGSLRGVRIGPENEQPIDWQPCAGTRVASTAEIGNVIASRIEKNPPRTRRVMLGLIDPD